MYNVTGYSNDDCLQACAITKILRSTLSTVCTD